MKRFPTTRPILLACAIAFASPPAARSAIDWWTVDGGGAAYSAGGAFQLSGTIGQCDASSDGGAMAGGRFTLVGGFWAIADAACACPGDVNHDCDVDGRDIQPFVDCLLGGDDCAGADLNADAAPDFDDVQPFVERLITGGGCQ